jgi:hypothetical protein
LLEIFWRRKWWVSNGLAVDAPQLRVLRGCGDSLGGEASGHKARKGWKKSLGVFNPIPNGL